MLTSILFKQNERRGQQRKRERNGNKTVILWVLGMERAARRRWKEMERFQIWEIQTGNQCRCWNQFKPLYQVQKKCAVARGLELEAAKKKKRVLEPSAWKWTLTLLGSAGVYTADGLQKAARLRSESVNVTKTTRKMSAWQAEQVWAHFSATKMREVSKAA